MLRGCSAPKRSGPGRRYFCTCSSQDARSLPTREILIPDSDLTFLTVSGLLGAALFHPREEELECVLFHGVATGDP